MQKTLYTIAAVTAAAFAVVLTAYQASRDQPDHDLKQVDPSEILDARIAASHRHLQAKAETTRQVIRKEITLLEAAARFRDLNEGWGEFNWQVFRESFSGSDDERHCKEVIRSVSYGLRFRPERRKVVEALREQLEELLRRGPLKLPQRTSGKAKS